MIERKRTALASALASGTIPAPCAGCDVANAIVRDLLVDLREKPTPKRVESDVCIVGGGPAGLCIAAEFFDNGASVTLLKSGFFAHDDATQLLNLGWSNGPMVRDHPFYLLTSRLRGFGGSQRAWGGWCVPLTAMDFEQRAWVPHERLAIDLPEFLSYQARAAAICGIHPSAAELPSEAGALRRRSGGAHVLFRAEPPTVIDTFGAGLQTSPNVTAYGGAVVTSIGRTGTRVAFVRAGTIAGDELEVAAENVVLMRGRHRERPHPAGERPRQRSRRRGAVLYGAPARRGGKGPVARGESMVAVPRDLRSEFGSRRDAGDRRTGAPSPVTGFA